MDLIVFHIFRIAEHRLPVGFRMISQGAQQLVAFLAVPRPDNNVDIPEGSQLRHRVILPQDKAFHQDMVNPVPGQGLAEHLRQRRPAGKQRDGVQANPSQRCVHLFLRADGPGHGHVAQNSGNAMDLSQLHQLGPVHILPHLRLFLPKVSPQQMEKIGIFTFHTGDSFRSRFSGSPQFPHFLYLRPFTR